MTFPGRAERHLAQPVRHENSIRPVFGRLLIVAGQDAAVRVVNVRDSGEVFLAAGADPITVYFTVENAGEHADDYAISSRSDGLDPSPAFP